MKYQHHPPLLETQIIKNKMAASAGGAKYTRDAHRFFQVRGRRNPDENPQKSWQK
jgi:hypothetical protein